ncbi:lipid A export permease/ATP-binding protein MsbA [Marinimicrobium alkaliphilum]|uniref:lipid A export permease/ATP-binding protein MsbA n=1 Tax=Marinimicrobium alkaliphilum TaxID=2202654 RepID=UPI000DBA3E2B|nr:lipid A export permease/ATP-binding protein MsbA [Marinimicrobium alkaliphilum]
MSDQPVRAPGAQPGQSSQTSLKVYTRLLAYLKPYWAIFVFSIFGFVLYSASQPALAQFMEYLLDFINDRGDSPVYMPTLIIMAIVTVRSVGAFLGNYLIQRVSFSVVHNLRVELFNRMTGLPGRYFDNHSSGHLVSVITFNVNGVTTAATDALKTLIREGTTVIALLGYLFYKDWQLTLLMLLVTPFIAVLVGFVGKRLRRLSTRVQHSMGDITQVSSEMINGYRVMRGFGGERYEKRRFFEASLNNFRQNMKIVLTSSLNTPAVQLLIAIAMGSMLLAALTVVEIDNAAAFVAYFVAVGMILKPMRQLSEVVPTIQKGVAAADSIFQLIDEPVEADTGTREIERAEGAVEFCDVDFAYGNDGTLALKGVNLSVQPGEVIALVGRSGSGKSTLVSLIPRFYDATGGEVRIDGAPVKDYTLASLRHQIALVSQQVTLFNDSIAANIAYGDLAECDREAIKRAADAAYATHFIEQMPEGFDTVIGEAGTRLSGGQRQRLAIARALLKDAPILILDEATSALDTESERYIQQALERVMEGRTTFVVAHRLSTIERADRIVVMADGEVAEVGTHAELLAKGGHYARLHAMQFKDEAL